MNVVYSGWPLFVPPSGLNKPGGRNEKRPRSKLFPNKNGKRILLAIPYPYFFLGQKRINRRALSPSAKRQILPQAFCGYDPLRTLPLKMRHFEGKGKVSFPRMRSGRKGT